MNKYALLLKSRKLSPHAKLLFFYIYHCASNPMIPKSTIKKDLGWGDTKVTKAINELVEGNLIKVETSRDSETGNYTYNKYFILF